MSLFPCAVEVAECSSGRRLPPVLAVKQATGKWVLEHVILINTHTFLIYFYDTVYINYSTSLSPFLSLTLVSSKFNKLVLIKH